MRTSSMFASPNRGHGRILLLVLLSCCISLVAGTASPNHHQTDLNEWMEQEPATTTTVAETMAPTDPNMILPAPTRDSDIASYGYGTGSSASASSATCLLSKDVLVLEWNETSQSFQPSLDDDDEEEDAEIALSSYNGDGRQLHGSYDPLSDIQLQQDDSSSNHTERPKLFVRECGCATEIMKDAKPIYHYCEHTFDQCAVVFDPITGTEVTCARYGAAHSFFKSFVWVLVFWFVGLAVVLFVSDLGSLARGYMGRRFRCCRCGPVVMSQDERLEGQVDRLLAQQPERAVHLYRQGRQRELVRLQRQLMLFSGHGVTTEADSIALRASREQYPELCNALELKTKVFTGAEETEVSTSTATDTEATPESSEELTASNLLRLESESRSSRIHSFPREPPESDADLEEAEPGAVHCAICLDRLQVGDVIGDLPCQHVFHKECLKGWLQKKNTCPLCQHRNIATPRYLSDGDEEDDENDSLDDASTSAENAWRDAER